ncbi:UDP-N-acetylmuramoyl-L-alanyl-D-glutamate--2,6-diaminopimelate ligase [Candidatus Paracaedibacter symbiosus]|uniref:UDP-N-acetylmuramoyl-L-alanyl-D-glutamate--2, 6-diaminopimelate ligase n=1 Tax=Candidatus Paracaedibacter symbiosus TaxID=244582 RepID=UPI00068D79D9|nr:UDP-N-acetylmuramoyl-L-alanyl-D-glutamate--2,6-diaminopimelate ligase [Candidatus Paracaedibacter symbiosus]
MNQSNLLKDNVNFSLAAKTFAGIKNDSRQVKTGDLFVAITCDDVISHVILALKNGAAGVVIESGILVQNESRLPKALYIPVENTRQALSELAQLFYPKQPKAIAAVTGTNGKSSVATFVRQIWGLFGLKAASFGTLGLELTQNHPPEISLPKLTTPDAISLHQLLQALHEAEINHFIFEASSHGLDQYRLHGAKVTVAAFTNLTQDHLDYHGSMEAYFEAKSKLFTEVLTAEGTAVINLDSSYAQSLILLTKSRGIKVVTYGIETPADVMARNISLHNHDIEFDIVTQDKIWEAIRIPVVGNFQVENILCAIGMVMAEGITLDAIMNVLPHLTSALGRMQLAGTTTSGAAIYVDYAHTPDALIRALQALKDHLPEEGKLHVVFGCGGNRDTGKRASMGEAANECADVVFVTDDNPRLEDPSFIRAQVLSHCPKGQEVADRFVAISQAIQGLGPQDILLIAGKGHEIGQIIRNDVIPFDDVQVVRQILGS